MKKNHSTNRFTFLTQLICKIIIEMDRLGAMEHGYGESFSCG